VERGEGAPLRRLRAHEKKYFCLSIFSLFERRLFIFSNILLTAIAALPDLLLGRRIAIV